MEIRHHYTGEETISTGTLEAIKVKVVLQIIVLKELIHES
jgi:hypothetical protein